MIIRFGVRTSGLYNLDGDLTSKPCIKIAKPGIIYFELFLESDTILHLSYIVDCIIYELDDRLSIFLSCFLYPIRKWIPLPSELYSLPNESNLYQSPDLASSETTL